MLATDRVHAERWCELHVMTAMRNCSATPDLAQVILGRLASAQVWA